MHVFILCRNDVRSGCRAAAWVIVEFCFERVCASSSRILLNDSRATSVRHRKNDATIYLMIIFNDNAAHFCW